MPFDHTNSATLADAIALLKAPSDLTATQQRDMISAVNRVATFLNRPPADLPTDAPSLRELLASIHPAQAGISAKSLSNVKTALTKALQTVGYLPEVEPKAEQTKGWQSFLATCKAKHQVFALSRLVTYCCNRGIEPDGVNDDVMKAFQAYLDKWLLGKDPAKLCKEMAQTWNSIVQHNGLVLPHLNYRKRGQYRARPLISYPEGLQKEIESYLDKLAHADLFEEGGPDKPLRPASLRNTRAHIRQYLDALVSAGEDPMCFESLKDVVTAANIKLAFTAIMDRRGLDHFPPALHNLACTLASIARHHLNLKPKKLNPILKLKKKVAYNPSGMTSKNAKRLAQFDEWQNVIRLMCLPEDLMDRAMSNPTSRTSALQAMHAAAVAILLACPMRVKNLADLNLDQHLISQRNGTHTIYTLRIEGNEVKNLEPIEVQLNAKNSQLLHRYIMKFRHMVSKGNGAALFPRAKSSEPRNPASFGGEIKAVIYRETGLQVNAHLFRHIAAYLFLKKQPGEFETVRRLLKHKKLQTTMEFYAQFASKWSYNRYDEVVLSELGRGDD